MIENKLMATICKSMPYGYVVMGNATHLLKVLTIEYQTTSFVKAFTVYS